MPPPGNFAADALAAASGMSGQPTSSAGGQQAAAVAAAAARAQATPKGRAWPGCFETHGINYVLDGPSGLFLDRGSGFYYSIRTKLYYDRCHSPLLHFLLHLLCTHTHVHARLPFHLQSFWKIF